MAPGKDSISTGLSPETDAHMNGPKGHRNGGLKIVCIANVASLDIPMKTKLPLAFYSTPHTQKSQFQRSEYKR